MKLFIASDHAGYALKTEIVKRKDVEWIDLGPISEDSVDYPLFAQKLSRAVLDARVGDELLEPCGVLICGSGVGMSIAANRFKGIRAALALREDVATLSRAHNGANVLCLGARLVSAPEALKILDAWMKTPFEGGRHGRRVSQIEHPRKEGEE